MPNWCHSVKCQLLIWGLKPRIQILKQVLSIKLRLQNHCGGDCSNEIKRHFLLGRITMSNLDSVLKSRDISLPAKVHIVTAMVFPVVTYRCERWTIKKGTDPRTDAFELQCWKRLLRIPWTARRSNQSSLKEINSEYSLKGPMLKLKLQSFGHLAKSRLIGKDPDAGKD